MHTMYILFQILLSTTAAGYGWFCAPYNKDTSKNPLEMRVRFLKPFGLKLC